MEFWALILILLASTLHLAWNVLTKKAEDKMAFMYLATFPVAVIGLFRIPELFTYPRVAIYCVFATGIAHSLYAYCLTTAYKYVDISFAYPYFRGLGALLATIGGIIILEERLSLLGSIGVGVAILATLLEPLTSFKQQKQQSKKGVFLTIATGTCIACYILIDKVGVSYIPPFTYLCFMFFMTTVWWGPYLLYKKRLVKEFRKNKFHILLGGLFMTSAYITVLYAMPRTQVGYVVSARASGIVLSALAGIIYFKESVSRVRWISISLITLGVVCMGLG